MGTLFWIAVGLFVGWNFPQPTYAKLFQAWFVAKMRNLFGKTENKEEK